MPEDRKRPTSFGEAGAKLKMGAIESLSDISEWAEGYQDQLKDAQKAAKESSEDKGVFGTLLTWGTTGLCVYATGGLSIGECVALGTAVGTATRAGIDWADDAEELIPGTATPVATKFYNDKSAEIAKDLNESADALHDFHANEWKSDLLLQVNDTWTAYKMASGAKDLGWFDEKDIVEEAAEEVVGTGSEFFNMDSLFDTKLIDIDTNINVS